MSTMPITLFSMSALGGACAILLPAAGKGGNQSMTPFAQWMLSTNAALFWGCLALQKALHEPSTASCLTLHRLTIFILMAGSAISLLPLAIGSLLGDLGVVAWIVVTGLTVIALQEVKNACGASTHWHGLASEQTGSASSSDSSMAAGGRVGVGEASSPRSPN
jgi:hypothetical protein